MLHVRKERKMVGLDLEKERSARIIDVQHGDHDDDMAIYVCRSYPPPRPTLILLDE